MNRWSITRSVCDVTQREGGLVVVAHGKQRKIFASHGIRR
jgi:hypothetical protein